MFIPDFWVGVGATIGVEIAAIICLIIAFAVRKDDNDEVKK